jgi:hypothetical protein
MRGVGMIALSDDFELKIEVRFESGRPLKIFFQRSNIKYENHPAAATKKAVSAAEAACTDWLPVCN